MLGSESEAKQVESKAQFAIGRIAGILLAHSLKLGGGPKTPSDAVQEIGVVVKEYMDFDPDKQSSPSVFTNNAIAEVTE